MRIKAESFDQKDVVLVAPPAKKVVEHYDEPPYPHIGLGYVGGYLDQNSDIACFIIDGKLYRYSIDQTIEAIISRKPRILGLSAKTHEVKTAALIAARIKKYDPEILVVLGSFHASFMPERTLDEFPEIDIVVVGEGEVSFAELAVKWLNGDSISKIPGLVFRENGRIINNGRSQIKDSLDDFNEPGWHLFDQSLLRKYCTVMPIMSQRGCPFHCNFCSRPYGRKVRARTPSKVVEEMERSVKKYGIEEFTFYDETFSVDKKHVIGICKKIIDRKLDVRWTSMVHANTVNNELIKQMKEAGCYQVGFGVESGDEGIIAEMQKGVNTERIKRAARVFKKEKLDFGAYFIFGHPGENLKTAINSIKLAVSLNAKITAFGIMVPYPGTEIWGKALKGEGGYKKPSEDWDDYNKQVGNAVELETLSRRKMEILQLVGYLSVYLINFRFIDAGKVMFKNMGRLKVMLSNVFSLKGRKRTVSYEGANLPASEVSK